MMYWNGQMGVWGYLIMSISMVLLWGAVITGIVLLARSLRTPGATPGLPGFPPHGYAAPPAMPPVPPRSAEDLLAERFAKGEIDAAEYQSRLEILSNRNR